MISNYRREMSSGSEFVSILDRHGKAGSEAKAAWDAIRLVHPEFPLPLLTHENRRITLDWSHPEGYFSIEVIEIISSFGSDIRIHWKGLNNAERQKASCELLNLNGAIHMWKPWLALILDSYNKKNSKQTHPEPELINEIKSYAPKGDILFNYDELSEITKLLANFNRIKAGAAHLFDTIDKESSKISFMSTENKTVDGVEAKKDNTEIEKPVQEKQKNTYTTILELESNNRKALDEYRAKVKCSLLMAIESKLTEGAKLDENNNPIKSPEVIEQLEQLRSKPNDIIRLEYNKLYPTLFSTTDGYTNKFEHTNNSLNILKAIAPGMLLTASGLLTYMNNTYTDASYADTNISLIDDIKSVLNDMLNKFSEDSINKVEWQVSVENTFHHRLGNFDIYERILQEKILKEFLKKEDKVKRDKELADFNKKHLDKLIKEGRAKSNFESGDEKEKRDSPFRKVKNGLSADKPSDEPSGAKDASDPKDPKDS